VFKRITIIKQKVVNSKLTAQTSKASNLTYSKTTKRSMMATKSRKRSRKNQKL
jgi:hypothetical protein